MAKSQTAHLQNIEILRSVSIVGVVLYHSFCPWLLDWNWIENSSRPILSYLFNGVMTGRMPLFFSVSGYLFAYLFVEDGKYQNFFDFVKNKLRRLLLPCLLFSILLSLLGGGNIIKDFLWGRNYLWFLKVLFLCFLVCWPIAKHVNGKGEIAVMFASVIMIFLPGISFFSIGRFFHLFQFFYMGFLLCRHREVFAPYLQTTKALIFHTSVFVFLCTSLGVVYIKGGDAVFGDFNHMNLYARMLTTVLMYYTIILGFSIVNHFLDIHCSYQSKVFEKINSLSYGIYLIHCYLAEIIGVYVKDPFVAISSKIPTVIFGLFFFIVLFSLSWGITYLFKKTKVGQFLL